MELKPCPFCGSAAKMIDDVRDGIFNYYKIFCTNIYCDAQMGWRTDADVLAKEWNRRMKKPRLTSEPMKDVRQLLMPHR